VRLLKKTKVAIITGGRYTQFVEQVFSILPLEADKNNLFIFPTSGASYYRFSENEWQEVYANRLSSEEVSSIKKALLIAQEKSGVITE
jgi:phosphomannomutase